MLTLDINDPQFAPFFIIVPAIIMVVLLALTMRSVIMREKAMIRQRRQDTDARSAYESRWRNLAA